MRRLFSNFAHGAPAAGLLLLRLAVGIALIDHAVAVLITRPTLASAIVHSIFTLLGVLLLVGLWTPIASSLGALGVVWEAVAHSASWRSGVSTGIMAVALTLLGPGAWSVDAWLYGWKQIRILDPHRDQGPTV